MVVTTSSKMGWLEEYLAVEDLREFPYLLFVEAEVGKCLPTWSSLGIFAAVG